MKKKVAGLIAVLCLCVMALAACGSETGTYKLSSMSVTYEGQTTTLNIGDEFEGTTITADMFVLELKKDDVCVYTSPFYPSGSATGTWKKDGKTISITIDADTISGTLDGKTLTLEDADGITIVLKK